MPLVVSKWLKNAWFKVKFNFENYFSCIVANWKMPTTTSSHVFVLSSYAVKLISKVTAYERWGAIYHLCLPKLETPYINSIQFYKIRLSACPMPPFGYFKPRVYNDNLMFRFRKNFKFSILKRLSIFDFTVIFNFRFRKKIQLFDFEATFNFRFRGYFQF